MSYKPMYFKGQLLAKGIPQGIPQQIETIVRVIYSPDATIRPGAELIVNGTGEAVQELINCHINTLIEVQAIHAGRRGIISNNVQQTPQPKPRPRPATSSVQPP